MENEQKKQPNYLGQLFGAVLLVIFIVGLGVLNLGESESVTKWIQENRLTTVFGSILIIIFLFSSVNWLPIKASDRLKTLPYPTLFLLIGILGTFVGIWLGLNAFDAQNIKKSIPNLIDSLTIAFTTSIGGIICTIVYRVLVASFGVPEKQEVGAAEVIESINEMAKKLDNFIDDLTGKVVQGLTEALQKLTTQLEKVITDQLGEAFRQLNESITKLNEWVIAYKEQVETLTAAYQANLIGIEAYNEKAEKIVQTLEPLQEYIKQIETAIEKIGEPIHAFADLAKDAKDAFPIIKENLENITTEFSNLAEQLREEQTKVTNLVQAITEKTANLDDELKRVIEERLATFATEMTNISQGVATEFSRLTEQLRDEQTKVTNLMQQITEKATNLDDEIKQIIDARLETFSNEMTNISQGIATEFSGSAEKLNQLQQETSNLTNKITEEADKFNNELQGAIRSATNEGLNQFSEALAGISEKFAKDYMPITEGLRKLLADLENRQQEQNNE